MHHIVTNRHYNNASQNLLADCINSTLRLSMETDEGVVSIKGLPEYCFSGVWRRICAVDEDRWTDTEQKLACKQLGYNESGEIIILET